MFKRNTSTSIVLALILALLFVAGALASTLANGYSLDRWTVDAGGGVSAQGRYSLAGTIGQFDAGSVMTGGTYSLTGGYWGTAGARMIFLPLVLR